MTSITENYKKSLQEPGMAVGQRVTVRKLSQVTFRVKYEGQGTVCAFLATQTETAGLIDRIVSAVVQTDDGRFLDCALDEIKMIDEEKPACTLDVRGTPRSGERGYLCENPLCPVHGDVRDTNIAPERAWLAQVDADPLYGQTEHKGTGVNNAGGPNGEAYR